MARRREVTPNRLRALRESRGLSQEKLAALAEVSTSQVSRLETGRTQLFTASAKRIAAVLGLASAAELIDQPDRPAEARIFGEVGAGAEVIHLDDGTEFVPAPPELSDPIAVRVRGTSMMPAYREGDVLFAEHRAHVPADVLDRDCIVQVHGGPCLVKLVQRGSAPGLFRLFSYADNTQSDDVALDWAAPVRWVRR